jgi:hypothetical protein
MGDTSSVPRCFSCGMPIKRASKEHFCSIACGYRWAIIHLMDSGRGNKQCPVCGLWFVTGRGEGVCG